MPNWACEFDSHLGHRKAEVVDFSTASIFSLHLLVSPQSLTLLPLPSPPSRCQALNRRTHYRWAEGTGNLRRAKSASGMRLKRMQEHDPLSRANVIPISITSRNGNLIKAHRLQWLTVRLVVRDKLKIGIYLILAKFSFFDSWSDAAKNVHL